MIKSEEYEVIGFIQKTCVCDKCMVEMKKSNFVCTSTPPQYVMKCPKCGKEENINCDDLQGQMRLVKKENKNEL